MNSKICYNCFHTINNRDQSCPFCGFPADIRNESTYPNALPCNTVLIDKYRIGRVLGQGGFGITYVAKDIQTGELVAVKEYFPDTIASRDESLYVVPYNRKRQENFEYGKKQFLEEAKTLAEFSGSPNIVNVRSYFEENGTACYVMEYLRGTSFKSYLKKKDGRISWEEAEKILLPVMEALEEVHSKGIIHRDVTPDNIALTDDGRVKLLDFGAARYSMGEQSKSLDVILKHGFAPYEQYMRHSRQGPFTDVYSLAASFYYAVTGETPPESVERIDEDHLVPPSGLGISIPVQKEAALLKALAVRSADRFQSMTEFMQALGHKPNIRKGRAYGSRPGMKPAAVMTGVLFAVLLFLAVSHLLTDSRTGAEEDREEADASVTASSAESSENTEEAAALSALELLTETASRGNATAQLQLGDLYYSGKEVEQDYAAALEWYTKAAQQGEETAQYILGTMYQHGQGTAQSYQEALKWYSAAGEQGNAEAQYQTGSIYEHGLETERDYEKALEWYIKAAQQNHAAAQYVLGTLYEAGNGTEQNYEEALSWYRKAADQDLPEAQYSVGWMYVQGLGTEQDNEESFRWFTKAAEQNYAAAQNNLGYMYMEGIGTDQDYDAARNWFTKAAEQGYGAASFSLGEMYLSGMGVEKDTETAIKWYERAVEQGYEDAAERLESVR